MRASNETSAKRGSRPPRVQPRSALVAVDLALRRTGSLRQVVIAYEHELVVDHCGAPVPVTGILSHTVDRPGSADERRKNR